MVGGYGSRRWPPPAPVTWGPDRLGEPRAANAITDVAGVRVGHRTVLRGDDGAPDAVRSGVTAIFPHEADTWTAPVYAATHILNGYGEIIGIEHVRRVGHPREPDPPHVVAVDRKVYDAAVRWIAGRDGVAGEALMPLVTECDDSFLARSSPIR